MSVKKKNCCNNRLQYLRYSFLSMIINFSNYMQKVSQQTEQNEWH